MAERRPSRDERKPGPRGQSGVLPENQEEHRQAESGDEAAASPSKIRLAEILKLNILDSPERFTQAKKSLFALQYGPVIKELQGCTEHRFKEKDKRTLAMLEYTRSQSDPTLVALIGQLHYRFLWLRLRGGHVRTARSIVDDDTCWQVIRLCKKTCQHTLETHLKVLVLPTDTPKEGLELAYFTQLPDFVKFVPREVTEKLTAFFAEHQLKTALYLRNLSKVIEVLENVVDSCMSIPKLRPFLLPLAQTRAIHQLSTFREYMQGADILPLEVNSFNDFIRKKVVTRDQEFSPYMASLICSSAFMLQVTISTLHAIPDSLSPETEQQRTVIGLDIEKFKILFQGVANAGRILKPHIRDQLHALLDALQSNIKHPKVEQVSWAVFRNAGMVFPDKRHRSFMNASKADSSVTVHHIESQIMCECFESEGPSFCRHCVQQQRQMWVFASRELERVLEAISQVLSVVKASLDVFGKRPRRVQPEALTALTLPMDAILYSIQYRLHRVLISIVESAQLFCADDGQTVTAKLASKLLVLRSFVVVKLMVPHLTFIVDPELSDNPGKLIAPIHAFYRTEVKKTTEYFKPVSKMLKEQLVRFSETLRNLSIENSSHLKKQVSEIIARLRALPDPTDSERV